MIDDVPTPGAAELLGHNLARLLAEQGLDEADFAKAVGLPGKPYVAASNLRQYLRGERWPRAPLLDRMASTLGVPRSELLREFEDQ